jgi:hypothetical protein
VEVNFSQRSLASLSMIGSKLQDNASHRPGTQMPRSRFRCPRDLFLLPHLVERCVAFLVAIRRRPSVRQLGYREGQPGTEALGPIASVK